ncbi:cytochrome P450 family protein [Cavenderia fasciculata]|uniref:Cytochrome P450 family protein n=1 Tax=Cavenderia fasciculata TaxID=261658 RepID=F4PHM8_CACFS|nr:cytochrome P450 family protein [Cavenderia fasciculata]EGG25212.1 cytochrome P450 family protein [Cavenderia fasciculata]|eukprot:XP_004363063.1 cytochrome P450 family protein [Cavenderia fasciculata]
MFLQILLIFILYIVVNFIQKNRKSSSNEPPSAFSIEWPLVGSLFRLGIRPHQTLTKWAEKSGPIFKFYMGDYKTVCVSDPQMIREIWHINMDNFHDVPAIPTMRVVSGDFSNIAMAREYRWRRNRNLCANTFSKMNLKTTSPPVLNNQCKLLMKYIDKIYESGSLFKVQEFMKRYSVNIILEVVFSSKMDYEDKRLDKLIQLTNQNFVNNQTGNIMDVVSILQPFYYIWIKYITGVPVDGLKAYMNELLQEHKKDLNPEKPRDLYDQIILDYGDEDVEGILRLGVDLYLTGVEAGAVAMEWVLLYVTNYPEIQQKVYEELKKVLADDVDDSDNNGMINLKHRINCPYTLAVIKEVMRVAPAAVFGLPRIAKEDVEIGGYTVTKGTQVMMNLHSTHHDKRFYEDPYVFDPNRWLFEDDNNRKANNMAFLPYGVGPRSCIGQHLSNDFMFIGISNILLNYNLTSPNGQNHLIDDTPIFGLTVRSKPFSVKLEKR